MSLFYASLSIAIVVLVYFALIEIYVTLFRLTGLTAEKARYQVVSMITGVGFTTSESEIITGDRTRRRLSIACMITGTIFNVAIIGSLINLVNSFSQEQLDDSYLAVGIIFGSTILIFIFLRLPFMVKFSQNAIEKVANKIFKLNSQHNVLTQIDTYGKSGIFQIKINEVPEFLCDKTLAEANAKATYGINIMMIKRNNRMVDITKDSIIQKKDTIWVFGSKSIIKECFEVENTKASSPTIHEVYKVNEIALIDNYGQDAMVEVTIHDMPKSLLDKPLIESNLRSKYFITVLKIKRKHAVVPVDKDTVLEVGDTVLLLGPYKGIKTVFDTKSLAKPTTNEENKNK